MLPTVGKHKASLKDELCIITKYENDIPYENFFETHSKKSLSPGFIKEMQRLYVFRFLVCLNCNYENRIEIRTGMGAHFPISCRENTYSLDPVDSASRIPKNVIKEWFENNDEMVIDVAKDMLSVASDITMFKFHISDNIRKYEKGKYISWVNSIYDRIRNMSGM
jgi:hypothetical protein